MPLAGDNPTFFDSSFVFIDWLSFRFLRSPGWRRPAEEIFRSRALITEEPFRHPFFFLVGF
jgi:hypothetical protein